MVPHNSKSDLPLVPSYLYISFQDSDEKSDISSGKDKTTKQKATNLILKLFKSSNVVMHSQSDPYIKATKDTKTYRKPSKPEELPNASDKVMVVNESINEGTKIT